MGEMTIEQQLESLIVRVERHQKALGLNDTAFAARYIRYIGSAKTWKDRLLARNFEQFNKEKHLQSLRKMVAELEGGNAMIADFYAAMPFAQQVSTLVAMLEGQTTDRRNAYVLATTGIGKSIIARHHVQLDPQKYVYVRMHENCRNQETHICRRFALALGCKSEQSAALSLQILIDYLQANPLFIFIDEAHAGGHKLMQVVKTLIDETAARFMQFAYPTEFDRVRTATAGSLDEAKQLIGRTMKPIFDDYRDGLKIPDIVCYLTQSGLPAEDAHDVSPRLLPMVRQNGNLRVLADAVADARDIAEQSNRPMDAVMIRQAVEAQCPRRSTKAGE